MKIKYKYENVIVLGSKYACARPSGAPVLNESEPAAKLEFRTAAGPQSERKRVLQGIF